MDRPLPVREPLSAPYWDGARDGKLVILRCTRCGYYVHPPVIAFCPSCRGRELEPTRVSGKGAVYGWSVMHSRGNPGFDDKLPFTVLVVELAEQRGLITIGNLIDGEPSELSIGTPLEVCFETLTDDVALPQWRIVR